MTYREAVEVHRNMNRLNYKGYYLKLNREDDKDVIERLEGRANKQGYIKRLIRDDITLDIFREGVQNGSIKVEK